MLQQKLVLKKLLLQKKDCSIKVLHPSRFCPQYVMPHVTEHVLLHTKELCKSMARASGFCKKYALVNFVATNRKYPNFTMYEIWSEKQEAIKY